MSLNRIAPEAVTKARPYADPSRVTVELAAEDAALVLSVRDYGAGGDEEGGAFI